MIAPLISLFARRPRLVLDHIEGYVELAQGELATLKRRAVKRAIAAGVALVTGIAGLVLLGVTVLLNATQPMQVSLWASILVPGVTLLVAIVAAVIAAGSAADADSESVLIEQLRADAAALRELVERE